MPRRYGIAASHDSVSVYKPERLAGCVGVSPALAVAAAIGLAVRDNGDQAKISDQMTYLSSRVDTLLTQVPAVRAAIEGTAK
ncbi:hypothetical protein ABZ567_06080 [Streptomyces sp. NPDC016459]|uniref:hypothetical protein n=1 Tax=Streptomyces sp. NPDC016459 TaxID=3157190 RepID=UPI00341138F8